MCLIHAANTIILLVSFVCVCVCLCGRVYVCGACVSCSSDTVASSRVAFLSTMQVRNAVCVCVLDLLSAPTGYVALSALS